MTPPPKELPYDIPELARNIQLFMRKQCTSIEASMEKLSFNASSGDNKPQHLPGVESGKPVKAPASDPGTISGTDDWLFVDTEFLRTKSLIVYSTGADAFATNQPSEIVTADATSIVEEPSRPATTSSKRTEEGYEDNTTLNVKHDHLLIPVQFFRAFIALERIDCAFGDALTLPEKITLLRNLVRDMETYLAYKSRVIEVPIDKKGKQSKVDKKRYLSDEDYETRLQKRWEDQEQDYPVEKTLKKFVRPTLRFKLALTRVETRMLCMKEEIARCFVAAADERSTNKHPPPSLPYEPEDPRSDAAEHEAWMANSRRLERARLVLAEERDRHRSSLADPPGAGLACEQELWKLQYVAAETDLGKAKRDRDYWRSRATRAEAQLGKYRCQLDRERGNLAKERNEVEILRQRLADAGLDAEV